MSKFDELRAERRRLEKAQEEAKEAAEAIKHLEDAVDRLGPLLQKYRAMPDREFLDHYIAAQEVLDERARSRR
jgi:hypothetical protein